MNLLTLSWKYLSFRPLATGLNVILLAFGLAIITVLLLVQHQFEQKMTRDSVGIDLVVGAKGSPLQLILSSVYHIDFPTGNIKIEEAQRISKSSRSNFYIVKDGIISTPDKHILLGITRKHLLDVAGNVQIRPISLEEVWEADEAFISATTKILLPVTQIDDRKVGAGKVGKVSLDLMAKFREREKAYLNSK